MLTRPQRVRVQILSSAAAVVMVAPVTGHSQVLSLAGHREGQMVREDDGSLSRWLFGFKFLKSTQNVLARSSFGGATPGDRYGARSPGYQFAHLNADSSDFTVGVW